MSYFTVISSLMQLALILQIFQVNPTTMNT